MSYPSNTGICINYLFPNAVPFDDYRVTSSQGITTIENWNDEIGDKPTPKEIEAISSEAETAVNFKAVREKRNTLLAESDWKANSDVTMSDAWKKYRQDLRDLPASNSDPTKIVFPTKPE